jgi:hypothetical protein
VYKRIASRLHSLGIAATMATRGENGHPLVL